MPKSVSYARLLAGFVVPHNVVELIRRYRSHKRFVLANERADAFKRAVHELGRAAVEPYSWNDAHSFLEGLGCDRSQVASGSIAEEYLVRSCDTLQKHIQSRPILGLQVGNFVGISLCHYTDFARRLDKNSIVISVDPNLTHRGIQKPQEKVIACLNRYGLQGNSMILTGYSLEKSVSNDGVRISNYDPEAEYTKELSCENQLPLLARLMPAQFDFVVIDGNHEMTYLARELAIVHRLLKTGGMIVLDDVAGSVEEIYGSLLNRNIFEIIDPGVGLVLAKKK